MVPLIIKVPGVGIGKNIWVWGLAALLALVVLLAGIALFIDLENPPTLVLFVGRFHPMIVHFPIGLIILAAWLEVVSAVYRPLRPLRHATAFVLWLGAGSAILAAAVGFLLSLEGGYDESSIALHKWFGVAVAGGAVLAFGLKGAGQHRRKPVVGGAYALTLVVTVGILMTAGHLGSTLTHGPTYLTQYLPGPIRGMLGLYSVPGAGAHITNIDSARVYHDLVFPVLEARCVECHNATKEKGGLRLDTPEELFEGGDGGAVIEAGQPEESELWRRVTLPLDDEDVMPSDGAPPLTIGETELIRWWIAHGASLDQRVADIAEVPSSVATVLARLTPSRKDKGLDFYDFEGPPVDWDALADLQADGFGITGVADGIPLLHVSTFNLRAAFGNEELERLLPFAEQITWLDLSRTAVDDKGMEVIAQMPNLTRLHLERTPIGNAGIEHMDGLEYLAYLNVVGTDVGDEALHVLEGLLSLQTVYLWQTRVTSEGIARLKQRRPDVEIIGETNTLDADTLETDGAEDAPQPM